MMQVVAGLLQDARGSLLLARRPEHKQHGGLWEFPGGKLEAGESWHEALKRELEEELGIVIQSSSAVHVQHRTALTLQLRQVAGWTGNPEAREGQQLAWYSQDELKALARAQSMPPGDCLLAESLCHPLLAITPANFLHASPEPAVQGWLRLGVTRVILRPSAGLTHHDHPALLAWLEACVQNGLETILHERCLPLFPDYKGPVHLQQKSLPMAETVAAGRVFSLSCHDGRSLQQALVAGARFALLSPVKPTRTHPDAVHLGWPGLQRLLDDLSLPVYALGGLGPEDVQQARLHGAVGVAGIRGFCVD